MNANVTTVRDKDMITKTQKYLEMENRSDMLILSSPNCVCTKLELKIVYAVQHILVFDPVMQGKRYRPDSPLSAKLVDTTLPLL